MNQAVTLAGQSVNWTVSALKNANYGFHGGVFLRLSLFSVYLQPELLFGLFR
jgi:hypothetical protein